MKGRFDESKVVRDKRGRFSYKEATGPTAWGGKQQQTRTKLTKQQTGEIGEQVTLECLRKIGVEDGQLANAKVPNFPVDVVGGGMAIEVKAGLVSNSTAAQQWRATIGQPGKAETEWLRTASPEDKRAWNQAKQRAILSRKRAAVTKLSRTHGVKLKPMTIALIINPDTKRADIYHIPGHHLRVGWRSDTARKYFAGTFTYG